MEKKNTVLLTLFVVVVLLVAGGIVYAVTNRVNKDQSATPTVQSNPSVAPSPSGIMQEGSPVATQEASTGAVKTVTVVGSNFAFAPTTIKVKKGDTVKVVFQNDAGFHDFVIDEFNAKTEVIGAGKEQTVTFVADKTGSFKYYCSVGNHRKMGMEGTLIVE